MKLTITLKTTPDPPPNCCVCGRTIRGPVIGVLQGAGNSEHALCPDCLTLPQPDLLEGAIGVKRFLESWAFVQGQLVLHLEHDTLERPADEDLDVLGVEAQLEQDEDEK